jgi:hypothetical protein
MDCPRCKQPTEYCEQNQFNGIYCDIDCINQTGVRPECDNHKAAADMFVKYGGLDVSGVGACSCGRHGCYIPRALVDFQKGEK